MEEQLIFEETKRYILDKINSSNYPNGHPFLENAFQNDFIMNILIILKNYYSDKNIIDNYLSYQLQSHHKGVFSIEKFFQNINEITFLHYLTMSLVINNRNDILNSIIYNSGENIKGNKKYEYSFDYSCKKEVFRVNFEIKTVTCEPLLKEVNLPLVDGAKFIKTFFDEDITKFEKNLAGYTILNHSSQYKQIRSALKKIDEKFIKVNNNFNIGVVFCQFATSIEEFYAYLLHPNKGLVYKNKNIFLKFDALVFFSLTATPDIYLDEIYKTRHCLCSKVIITKIKKLY